MDTAKIYYDSEDNECSILQMVKREPEWAANRVQEGEKAQAETDELKADFIRLHTMAVKWVDKDHHDWQELMKLRWGE